MLVTTSKKLEHPGMSLQILSIGLGLHFFKPGDSFLLENHKLKSHVGHN